MPKRLEYRNYFAIATVIAVLVALVFSFHIHVPLRKTLLSKYTIAEDVSPLTFVPKRRSLLIIGRGRSGTSFVSKMLANGERVSSKHVKILPLIAYDFGRVQMQ